MQHLKYTVYALVNTQNNRAYIGRTTDILKRQEQHLKQLLTGKHPYKKLQLDFDRYGHYVFGFQILEDNIHDNVKKDRENYHIQNWAGNTYNDVTYNPIKCC